MTADEKKQILGGPLDGLFVKSEKGEIRAVLRKDKVVLVAIYKLDDDQYRYKKTCETKDLTRTTDALVVEVEPKLYGKMWAPKPYETPYNVYMWFPKQRG